jgi:hypothetical protein
MEIVWLLRLFRRGERNLKIPDFEYGFSWLAARSGAGVASAS